MPWVWVLSNLVSSGTRVGVLWVIRDLCFVSIQGPEPRGSLSLPGGKQIFPLLLFQQQWISAWAQGQEEKRTEMFCSFPHGLRFCFIWNKGAVKWAGFMPLRHWGGLPLFSISLNQLMKESVNEREHLSEDSSWVWVVLKCHTSSREGFVNFSGFPLTYCFGGCLLLGCSTEGETVCVSCRHLSPFGIQFSLLDVKWKQNFPGVWFQIM